MTYLETLESEGVDAVLVDGGDWLFHIGTVKRNPFAKRQLRQKAQLIVEAYNRFGYDAAAIAEHDLAFGLAEVKKLEKVANFPFLCANMIDETGELIFQPSTIVEKNGKKIGITAVVRKLPERYLANVAPGMTITDPFAALEKQLAEWGDQVDTVFLLGHLEHHDVQKVAKTMPQIDFILEPVSFQGAEPTWINDGEEFVKQDDTLLLRVSGQGSTVGRLDLYLRDRESSWVALADDPASPENLYYPSTTRLAKHIGAHPRIEKLVNEFLKGTRQFTGFEESDFVFEPSTDYLTVNTCQACHVEQTEFWRKTGHGKAYETLEKTGDQFRYDCVTCHVLAYGETFVDAHKVGEYKDVQCESCHGTNPGHPLDPAANPWPDVKDESCWVCHDPRVTRVPFDPVTAIPKIQCPPMKK